MSLQQDVKQPLALGEPLALDKRRGGVKPVDKARSRLRLVGESKPAQYESKPGGHLGVSAQKCLGRGTV
jgi:hypothetical protein